MTNGAHTKGGYGRGHFGGWKGYSGMSKGGWTGKGKGIMAFGVGEEDVNPEIDLHEEEYGAEELGVWGLRMDEEEETEEEPGGHRQQQRFTGTSVTSVMTGARLKRGPNRYAALASLEEEKDEALIMSVGKAEHEGWRKVTATVDLASVDHVSPQEAFQGFKLEPSEGKKERDTLLPTASGFPTLARNERRR